MGRKPKSSFRLGVFDHLSEETIHVIWGIVFIIFAVFFGLSTVGKAGVIGENIYSFFHYLMGVGYFLLPLMCALVAIAFFKSFRNETTLGQIISAVLFFLSGLGLVNIWSGNMGGAIGSVISTPLLRLLDTYATVVILIGIAIISFIMMFNVVIDIANIIDWYKERRAKKQEEKNRKIVEEINDEDIVINKGDDEETDEDSEEDDEETEKEEKQTKKKTAPAPKEEDESGISAIPAPRLKPFVAPPLSLLARDKGKPEVGDIKANANLIKRTLLNFGINVEMDEITIGPSVTRYALKPAEGIKLSRIVGLQNDLSLALAAHPLRIEAPIPGKSLVGIEIPNKLKTTVGLGTLLASKDFSSSEKPLLFGLGKDISGHIHFANIAKMPHVLIAGATGSGKSVTIHTLITSLLYRNSPETLRFIMIDPKRVELTLYKKIPHLLTPVITDAKKAILALKWATKEMDRRYDVLESEAVRDIDSYHKNIYEPELKKAQEKGFDESTKLPESLPYIVIIIDELADIMQTYPRELEASIVRLAQMSRAVGIHLVLSTQRPSVNVITGLIKANIPTRIALQVASQIDSRTILDTGGAEKLLGAGDMLYMSGDMSKPTRIQSAYISENEVKSIVKHISDEYSDELPDEIDFANTTISGGNSGGIFDANIENGPDEDDMYEDARQVVIEAGKASTSYIQRKLRVGYARAARLMDMLEDRGVIGPADGSKPREVIDSGESSDEEAAPEDTAPMNTDDTDDSSMDDDRQR